MVIWFEFVFSENAECSPEYSTEGTTESAQCHESPGEKGLPGPVADNMDQPGQSEEPACETQCADDLGKGIGEEITYNKPGSKFANAIDSKFASKEKDIAIKAHDMQDPKALSAAKTIKLMFYEKAASAAKEAGAILIGKGIAVRLVSRFLQDTDTFIKRSKQFLARFRRAVEKSVDDLMKMRERMARVIQRADEVNQALLEDILSVHGSISHEIDQAKQRIQKQKRYCKSLKGQLGKVKEEVSKLKCKIKKLKAMAAKYSECSGT